MYINIRTDMVKVKYKNNLKFYIRKNSSGFQRWKKKKEKNCDPTLCKGAQGIWMRSRNTILSYSKVCSVPAYINFFILWTKITVKEAYVANHLKSSSLNSTFGSHTIEYFPCA